MRIDIDKKRKKEKDIIYLMISLYCKKKHAQKNLCEECKELFDYACKRIDKCPFMETKTFCSSCKVHCYQENYRTQIQKVMRFSGPRMMLYHPIKALSHLYYTRKEKHL